MCEAYPGPRCSPCTKDKWQAAKNNLDAAYATNDTDKIADAKRKVEKAKWDYLTSPDGIELLKRAAEGAAERGDAQKAAAFTEQMNDAIEARQHQKETLKRLNDEQSRQSQERAVAGHQPSQIPSRPTKRAFPAPRPPMSRPAAPSARGQLIARMSAESAKKPLAKMKSDGVTPCSTSGYAMSMKDHAYKQAKEKGFSEERICATFSSPTRIYPSNSHPGQHRIINGDLCLVGEFQGRTFHVVTMYQDGVVTAPRADQMDTEEGRAFAARYAEYGSSARDGMRARQLA